MKKTQNAKCKTQNSKAENFLPSALCLLPSGNNRGVAAVMAVFVLILFSLLGLVICPLFSTQSAGKVNFLASQQALQIAEAGRQYAVWYLNTQDNLWATDWTPEQTLGRGTWRVKVESDTGIIVTSKGYVPQETNFRAQRIVEMEGIYDINESTHPIYSYALYTDSQDVIADSPLVFDGSSYTLSTTEDNDGDADVHSNETITFLNGSGQVVAGTVYSANQIDASGWTGTPWRDGAYADTGVILPPYMGEETKDYYRQRAQAQGNYHLGDFTITGDLPLNSILSGTATLIFAEGNVTIGNVIYRGPQIFGNNYAAGVGTIVAGGNMTINGYIEPHSGIIGLWRDRCTLALVSFGDVSYQEELIEPPYYEDDRILNIEDSAGEDTFIFNNENITITYQRNPGDWRSAYGWITIANHDLSYYNDVYIGTPSGDLFSYTFHTSSLPPPPDGNDWYYFRVQICRRSNRTQLRNQVYAYFINGSPSEPQHSIRCYEDAGFTQETSEFENEGTIYLKIYTKNSGAAIDIIEISDYPRQEVEDLSGEQENEINDGTYITCNFDLPALTTEYWWYNLYVTTDDGCYFAKQIYIKPAGATDVYSCIYADDKFGVPESSNLKITGNLATRRGLTLTPDSPLTNLEIEKDTEAFRGDLPWQQNDPNAVPGAVSFSYTWKEVKD
ncbi:MAG: hypothetical protein Q7J67_04855 [bacterium]|nr:hypothetical protein [bacterium]